MKKLAAFLFMAIIMVQIIKSQDCVSIDCSELGKSINQFRADNGKKQLFLSFTLCSAANQMAIALQDKIDKPVLAGSQYNSSQKMIYMKVRGIDANSKNTIGTFTMRHPAIDNWKVILEEEKFVGKNWQSIGVGLYKNYAVLWFSDKLLSDKPKVCEGTLNTQTAIIIKKKNNAPAIENARWLVEPTYYKIAYLRNEPGLLPVANDKNKWGYIGKNGQIKIPFQFERAYEFSEGLAGVAFPGGKFGYINTNGETVIEPKYVYGSPFNNGTTMVLEGGVNYVINRQGKKISDPSSDMEFIKTDWIAFRKGKMYAIKDVSGKLLKAPFCTDFFPYSEGMAGVKVYGKWGFMDENFNLVIKPRYTEKLMYSFRNGYARFKQNGKVGVIDKTGKVVLPAIYQDLYEYSDGLMAFQQDGLWGYMDLQGDVKIKPQYLSAQNFKYGFAVVKDSKLKTFLIDKNNKPLIGPVHGIHVFSSKLIGVNTKGGWGILEFIK